MPAEDHTSLVAFDAAVRAVCRRADDLAMLAQSTRDIYPIAAALVAAVADGSQETLVARITTGLDQILGKQTVPLDGEMSDRDQGATSEDLRAAKDTLVDLLTTRGLPGDRAVELADAVIEAAADLKSTNYPTTNPVAAVEHHNDSAYGLP